MTTTSAEPHQYRKDLAAGLVVSLVALPLCLGIALASNAPLSSGLVSGIVAGLIVSIASGSQLSISGPTASLVMVVSSAITTLGGFDAFLCAVGIAGILQILFAFLRAGALAGLFPNSVIKGMLAAIGIIIILKQIPHAVGRDSDFLGDEAFWQFFDRENSFTEILKALYTYTPGAVFVAITSLVVLISWHSVTRRFHRLSTVPAPLAAVLSGLALNEFFAAMFPYLALRQASGHLVSLPVSTTWSDFSLLFTAPKLSALAQKQTYSYGLTIAAIGSIETLLCLEATDRLDPLKRFSRPNRELFAQGLGNLICGLIGGIPMTSAVVRSSVNVYSGARTWISCFFHGALLLLAVAFFAKFLNRIPLASLAVVLILVGYRLTRISLFQEMHRKGSDQFIPFIVTVISIVSTNLLMGILIGFAVGIAFVIKSNYYTAVHLVSEGNVYLLRFAKDVSFVNKTTIKRLLAKIPSNSRICIDGSRAMFIDRDIQEIIEDFIAFAPQKNIAVELRHIEGKNYPLFKRAS